MTSPLSSLAADLTRAAAAITPAARAVVRENAKAVQATWRSTWPWSGSLHLPAIGRSVTYDVTGTEAEIGPVTGRGKGRQGSIGHIIEFGSVNSSPHPGGGPAAMKQAPIFAAELLAAARALVTTTATTTTSDTSRYNVRRR